MANNPYVNKVVFGNMTLIDTSNVTVTPDKLAEGYTALDASGALITGTASGGISIENIGAFAIRGVTATPYPFLLGMTWRQFLDSDFSTANFRIENNSVQYYVHPDWMNIGNPAHQPTDTIKNQEYYYLYKAALSYNITVLIDSPYNNDTAFAEPSTFSPNETDIVLTAFPGDGFFDHWEMPLDVQYEIVDGDIYSEQCVIIILDGSDTTITAVFTG